MDVLLLVALSLILKAKFKVAGKTGAGRYIGAMIGTVIGLELLGLYLTGNTESAGLELLFALLISFVIVIAIYLVGVKSAKKPDSFAPSQMINGVMPAYQNGNAYAQQTQQFSPPAYGQYAQPNAPQQGAWQPPAPK